MLAEAKPGCPVCPGGETGSFLAEQSAAKDAGKAQKAGSQQCERTGFRNVCANNSGFRIWRDVGDKVGSAASVSVFAVSADSHRVERQTVDHSADGQSSNVDSQGCISS